jgi:hypothetical protein
VNQPATPLSLWPWQRRFIYFAIGGLTVSGFAWLILKALTPNSDYALPPYHESMQGLIKIHVAFGLVGLIALGMVCAVHIPTGWRLRRNRLTGIGNIVCWSLLIASGYLLWYASEGKVKLFSSWIHWGGGVFLPLVFMGHLIKSKRLKARDTASRV